MRRDGYSTLGAIVLAVVGVLFAALMDSLGALTNATALLGYLAIFSFMIVPAVLCVPSRLKVTVYLVSVIAIVGLCLLPWNSRKLFLADLYSIQPGMSVADVDAIMAPYIKGSGWPANPNASPGQPSTMHDVGSGRSYSLAPSIGNELKIEGAVIYRHSDAAEYNSDWGIVEFRNGKVLRITFSAD